MYQHRPRNNEPGQSQNRFQRPPNRFNNPMPGNRPRFQQQHSQGNRGRPSGNFRGGYPSRPRFHGQLRGGFAPVSSSSSTPVVHMRQNQCSDGNKNTNYQDNQALISEESGKQDARNTEHDSTSDNKDSKITHVDNRNLEAETNKSHRVYDEKHDRMDEENSDEDDVPGYCFYCKIPFVSQNAYLVHLRSVQHTNNVMEARSQKNQQVTTEKPKASGSASVDRDLVSSEQNFQGKSSKDKFAKGQEPKSTLPAQKGMMQEKQEEDREGDTGFCSYCNISFKTPNAYFAHSRGIQHTNNVAMAEAKKGQKGSTESPKQTENTDFDRGTTACETNKTTQKEGEEEEEDTGFCSYCNLTFKTPTAYYAHSRGMQHTHNVMMAKQKEGDSGFEAEKVPEEVLKTEIPKPKLIQEFQRPALSKIVGKGAVKTSGAEQEERMEEMEGGSVETLESDIAVDGFMTLAKRNAINWSEFDDPQHSNQDFNPEELSKNSLDHLFYCKLCSISCSGEATFKMHVNGTKHQTNLQRQARGEGFLIKKKKKGSSLSMVKNLITVDADPSTARFYTMVKKCREPIIGLQYLIEFQKIDQSSAPCYVCNLCLCKSDGQAIIAHLVGVKHRLRYLKSNKPDLYAQIKEENYTKTKSEVNDTIKGFIQEIVRSEGGVELKVKKEVDADEVNESEGNTESGIKRTAGIDETMEEIVSKKVKQALLPERQVINKGARPIKKTHRPEWPMAQQSAPAPALARPPPPPRRLLLPPQHVSERDDYDQPRPTHSHKPHYSEDFYAERERKIQERLAIEERRIQALVAQRRELEEQTRYLDRKRELERPSMEELVARRRRRLAYGGQMDPPEVETPFTPTISPVANAVNPAAKALGLDSMDNETLRKLLAILEAKTQAQESQPLKVPTLEPSTASVVQGAGFQAVHQYQAGNEGSFLSADVLYALGQQQTQHNLQQPATEVHRPMAVQQPSAHVPPTTSGLPGQSTELINNLASSMIMTEDDAAVALKVSNSLTQALLKYRLQKGIEETAQTIEDQQTSTNSSVMMSHGSISSKMMKIDTAPELPAIPGLDMAPGVPLKQPTQQSSGARKPIPRGVDLLQDSNKNLLETIRQQTEQLKKKLISTSGSSVQSSSPASAAYQAQSQFTHSPVYNMPQHATDIPQSFATGCYESSQQSYIEQWGQPPIPTPAKPPVLPK